jgi:hypothetical protein
MILKEYNLSVRLPQEKAIDTGITLVQNDKDVYKLNVRIFDGVNEIDYSEVDSATITFLKRDNNVVQGNMAVEADQLSYTLGTNEIACPGKVLVGIQLFGSTERLSTARFVMSVERDLVTAEAVQSTSEFSILQQLKQDLEAIDVVELTNEFNVYKADNVSQRLSKTRDLSLTGVETVTGLRKKPKRITVFAAVNTTKKVCIGTYVVNDNAHATIVLHPSGNYYSLGNIIIRVYDTANDFTNATIQNVTDSQFEINWEHTGAGATGTLTYQIVIDY